MKDELQYWNERIDEYLLGKLFEEESQSFEIHCFANPEFLEEVRTREQMLELIKEKGESLLPTGQEKEAFPPKPSYILYLKNLFQSPKSIWIYSAAAAILLLAIFIVPNLLKRDIPGVYAKNFIEYPAFEGMLGPTLRGGDISIKVLSPKIGNSFRNEVEFKWKTSEEAYPLDLKIMNNKGQTIHGEQIRNNQYILKETFEPGLYYWALEHNGEMLYLGKFFVK